jgi:hypothetical protein
MPYAHNPHFAKIREGTTVGDFVGSLGVGVRVCGEFYVLAENTSVAQLCESFTYR